MHVHREGTTLPMTSVRSLSGWTVDAVVQDLGGDIWNGWCDGDGVRRGIQMESGSLCSVRSIIDSGPDLVGEDIGGTMQVTDCLDEGTCTT